MLFALLAVSIVGCIDLFTVVILCLGWLVDFLISVWVCMFVGCLFCYLLFGIGRHGLFGMLTGCLGWC